jgi:hypothetical protein
MVFGLGGNGSGEEDAIDEQGGNRAHAALADKPPVAPSHNCVHGALAD